MLTTPFLAGVAPRLSWLCAKCVPFTDAVS